MVCCHVCRLLDMMRWSGRPAWRGERRACPHEPPLSLWPLQWKGREEGKRWQQRMIRGDVSEGEWGEASYSKTWLPLPP